MFVLLKRIEIRIGEGKTARRVEMLYLFGVKIYENEVFYEDGPFFKNRLHP
jgi:hypothetical protein